MSIIQIMETKLQDTFKPEMLRVGNDSAQHEGHVGVQDMLSDVTHVSIVVVSDKFAGMSRVARSRAVHTAIADEIKLIHAITMLKTLTPEEHQAA